jgi:hypothetical protein
VLLGLLVTIRTNPVLTKSTTPELPPTRARPGIHKLMFLYILAPDKNVERDAVVVNDEACCLVNFPRPRHRPDDIDAASRQHLSSCGRDEVRDVFFVAERLYRLVQKTGRDHGGYEAGRCARVEDYGGNLYAG